MKLNSNFLVQLPDQNSTVTGTNNGGRIEYKQEVNIFLMLLSIRYCCQHVIAINVVGFWSIPVTLCMLRVKSDKSEFSSRAREIGCSQRPRFFVLTKRGRSLRERSRLSSGCPPWDFVYKPSPTPTTSRSTTITTYTELQCKPGKLARVFSQSYLTIIHRSGGE